MRLKFNNGNLALLCDNCGTIIATGRRIPDTVFADGSTNLYFCSDECKLEFSKDSKSTPELSQETDGKTQNNRENL